MSFADSSFSLLWFVFNCVLFICSQCLNVIDSSINWARDFSWITWSDYFPRIAPYYVPFALYSHHHVGFVLHYSIPPEVYNMQGFAFVADIFYKTGFYLPRTFWNVYFQVVLLHCTHSFPRIEAREIHIVLLSCGLWTQNHLIREPTAIWEELLSHLLNLTGPSHNPNLCVLIG